jgi:hypothetical protein
MKYFTPERYLRLGNLHDRQAFLAAHEDWERAIKAYKTRLRTIADKLPAGLRPLQSIYLHDARVLDIWQGAVSRFTITLQPESDPCKLVVLAYSLVEAPTIVQDVLPADNRSEPIAWLYDELDVEGASSLHNILLSNGWEIRLRFRKASVLRPVSLIPTPAMAIASAEKPALAASD